MPQSLAIPPFIGMNDRDPPIRLLPGWYSLAQNCLAISGEEASAFWLRKGWTKVNTTAIAQTPCQGLFAWLDDAGTVRQIYAGTSELYYSGAWATALTKNKTWTWAAANLFSFAFTQGQLYLCNGSTGGYGTNFRFDGTDLHPTGGKTPTVAPTVAPGAAGVLTGTYVYRYTHYDPTLDRETDGSPATTIVLAGTKATVTMTAPDDASFTQYRVYRTQASGPKYFFVATTAASPYTDNTTDASLGLEYGDNGTAKDTIGPVCKCIAAMSDGRIVMANDVTNGFSRRVWASFDNAHPESFPITGRAECGEENGAEIVCLVPLGDELAVLVEDSIWVLNSTCTSCSRVVPHIGGVGRWCAQGTPYGVLFVAKDGVYHFDGSQARKVSDPIRGTWDTVIAARLPYVATGYDDLSGAPLFYVGVTTQAGLTRNDKLLVLDCRTLSRPEPRWQVWTIRNEALCTNPAIPPANRKPYVAVGRGFVATFNDGLNDGAGTTGTKRGTATAATSTTLTDSTAAFTTTGSGLRAVDVHITGGTGAGQIREIQSNTATQLTVYDAWATTPDTTSTYQIGPIPLDMTSGEMHLGNQDHSKFFHSVDLELEQP